MAANGLRVLVDLLPLAHLHTSRATVPLQTNVIEASADMKRESEKEWYYGNKDKERLGPFGFDEVCEKLNKTSPSPKKKPTFPYLSDRLACCVLVKYLDTAAWWVSIHT